MRIDGKIYKADFADDVCVLLYRTNCLVGVMARLAEVTSLPRYPDALSDSVHHHALSSDDVLAYCITVTQHFTPLSTSNDPSDRSSFQ